MLIYIYFFLPKVEQKVGPQKQETTQSLAQKTEKTKPEKVSKKSQAEISIGHKNKELMAKHFSFKTGRLNVGINALGEIYSVELPKYFRTPKNKKNIAWNFNNTQGFNQSDLSTSLGQPNWKVAQQTQNSLTLEARQGAVRLRRHIELSKEGYFIRYKDQINNNSKASIQSNLDVELKKAFNPKKKAGSFFKKIFTRGQNLETVSWLEDGNLEYKIVQQMDEPIKKKEGIAWAGVSTKYFFLGLVPKNVSFTNFEASKISDTEINEKLKFFPKQISPGESTSYEYALYLGPKRIPELRKLSPDLDRVIAYGNWLGPIARALLGILLFFYKLIPNYGVAIILLTILVKMALFPLAYKSTGSMRKLQAIQPKMKEIREKFKSNPQRMNAEVMALYKTEKVNPLGGCLPMIIQMPVFFALYRVFLASFEMRHAPFFGWIQDLSAYDPLFITPILMSVLMVIQQRLTPTPGGAGDNEAAKIQKAMMKWMPLIFGAIMLFLPEGLTLYILVNALISIFQQLYLNKKFEHLIPIPKKGNLSQANGV